MVVVVVVVRGWGTVLFVKSKFSGTQLILLFFSPVPTPGVLLIKGGYAPTHISVYLSVEKVVTSYASHS